MTPILLRLVASYMLKYATAIESTLFINMKANDAHKEIDTAKYLANSLYNEATRIEADQINQNK